MFSEEQRKIIRALQTHNVVVDAVAGSGKTTTVLGIGQTYIKMNILLLTYNSRLKQECRDKFKLLGVENVKVHNYHSFFVEFYDEICHTDTMLK